MLNVHSLHYPRTFLKNLPVLLPRPHPHQPVRAIDAERFADIHLAHFTSDVPDSVLFPFLHGLEGDNHAQNTFFAGSGGLAKQQHDTLTVPSYRGLMWVACDEDSDHPREDHDHYDDDFEFDDDSEDDSSHDMQLDEPDPVRDSDTPTHMHPQALRKPATPITIDTTPSSHDRRLSTSSTTTTSSDSHFGFASASYSTTSSSPCTSPATDIEIDDCIPTPASSVSPPSPSPPPAHSPQMPLFTSTFRPAELLTTAPDGTPMFIPPRIPDGISLRNFGIQVPIYATLSDIVIYSPSGPTRAAFALAERFKAAIERIATERAKRYEAAGLKVDFVGEDADELPNGGEESATPRAQLVAYNVFILTDTLPTIVEKVPWLLSRTADARGNGGAVAPTNADGSANTDANRGAADAPVRMNAVDFAQRERDEMRELTKASPILGDTVFLGNSNDVPLPKPWLKRRPDEKIQKDSTTPKGEEMGSSAEEWADGEDDPFDSFDNPAGYDLCIECRDYAPFPTQTQLRHAEAHLAALDALWSARRFASSQLPSPSSSASTSSTPPPPRPRTPPRTPRPAPCASQIVHLTFPASPAPYSVAAPLLPFLSFLSALVSNRQHAPSTRKKRVLIYSSDGYTESSVLALCMIMKERGFDLPNAYLELQVEMGRSFFVYQSDLGVLKRVEAKLGRDRDVLALATPYVQAYARGRSAGTWSPASSSSAASSSRPPLTSSFSSSGPDAAPSAYAHAHGRAASNSVSFPPSFGLPSSLPTPPLVVPSQNPLLNGSHGNGNGNGTLRRPRASTSPLPPPHIDHQTWFNDPRFDGSFPSRVLPFLYLGNLNHATNAYMLHALGITHVVSVGECALVPPFNIASDDSSAGGYQFVAGKGPGGQGSLWIEEREGRIKVLDIKGVCDDGIDSLQPQLQPVCDWIDRARLEGGKVLVHCRVGVSRSATVTIAYVMKHLAIPLVDAYLIVRSRRLSVLIQPNMRLLYNLCGWEVKLAQERAGGDTARLRQELARSLNWPYLAREVHRLNEKYLG